MPNPDTNPELYRFRLADRVWLGEVVLSGHERAQSWDIKPAKGQDGGTTTRNGEPPGQFECEFLIDNDPLADVDLFEDWDAMQSLIESTTSGRTPIALPVYHADLARNRYTRVVNGGIGGMLHDGKGGARVKVKFIEYRPAKPKPAVKPKAKPGAPGGDPTKPGRAETPDPNAAAKRELAALQAQARAP